MQLNTSVRRGLASARLLPKNGSKTIECRGGHPRGSGCRPVQRAHQGEVIKPYTGPPEAEDPHAKDVHPCDAIALEQHVNVTLNMSAPKGVDSALLPNATAPRRANGSEGNGTTIHINGTVNGSNGSNVSIAPAPLPTPAPAPIWDGNDAPACVVRRRTRSTASLRLRQLPARQRRARREGNHPQREPNPTL